MTITIEPYLLKNIIDIINFLYMIGGGLVFILIIYILSKRKIKPSSSKGQLNYPLRCTNPPPPPGTRPIRNKWW